MGGVMINTSIYLKIVSFSNLYNWSVQYLSETPISFNTDYPLVRIGDFLKRNKTAITIEDNVWYKRATIKVRNGGVFLRDKEIGSNIGTKNQFVIQKGQFLLSKIDARNGAVGVVPQELDRCIITGNFWTFDVDYSKVNPFYLSLVTTTPEFIQFCEMASNGTTNRHYLQEPLFLDIKVPLPSLEEQHELVACYNRQIALAKELEKQAAQIQQDIEMYLLRQLGITIYKNALNVSSGLQFICYKKLQKWAISEISKESKYSFDSVKYSVRNLSEVITFFEGGKTPSTTIKEYWGSDVFWVSAKDMKEFHLKTIADKLSHKGVSESKLKVYPPGTILGVFRSGILRHSFPICITEVPVTINQDIKAIGVNTRIISPYYLLYYLSTLQDLVLERAQKKGVTVESINTDEFMRIPIVCPDKEEQKEIVTHISALKDKINNLLNQAEINRISALRTFEENIF